MNLNKFLFLFIALIVAACGGGSLDLGDFPPITKTEGNAPFALVAPSSKSPASFTFTSSDTSVATISGNIVTIMAAGTTIITAHQDSIGSFSSASKSTTLTVLPRTCTAPATRQNGNCMAPTTSGNYVTRSGHTWMPVQFIDNQTNASSYCTTTTINGMTGWRLPTEFELSDLYVSGMMNGQGWALCKTWSSTPSTGLGGATVSGYHRAVNLSSGAASDERDEDSAYVACVR